MTKNSDGGGLEKIETLVGVGSTIEGDIAAKNSILVNGIVTGDVTTGHSIRVGKTGEIRGNVKAITAIVGGVIRGDLEAMESTVLGSNSRLLGDLKTTRLTIEEGATFEGRCVMLEKEGKDRAIESAEQTQTRLSIT